MCELTTYTRFEKDRLRFTARSFSKRDIVFGEHLNVVLRVAWAQPIIINTLMKDQFEKDSSKNGNTRMDCPMRCAGICRTVLCIFLALTICSCCALLEILKLRNQTRTMISAADSEAEKIRIYIDQGHNPYPYHNSGAEGNSLYEQDLTFSIGHLLAELLREDGRFEVCLSRPDENTVLGIDNISSLKARVDGAVAFHADYFISLHINAFAQDTANGIEVFVSGADRESFTMGHFLLRGMVDSTNLRERGLQRGDELYVLKNAAMPAVLLEMGFISNAQDAALLSEHPEWFAQGIYDGIVAYFETAYTLDLHILLGMIGTSEILAAMMIFVVLLDYDSNKRTRDLQQGNTERSDTSC